MEGLLSLLWELERWLQRLPRRRLIVAGERLPEVSSGVFPEVLLLVVV